MPETSQVTLAILKGYTRCKGCNGRGYFTLSREIAGRVYMLRQGCAICSYCGWLDETGVPVEI